MTFLSLISRPISKYLQNLELGSEQAGFWKDYFIADIFFCISYAYWTVYKEKLYCCFVDYRKAFDMVPRVLL
jgi:hypothetical protein